MRDENGNIKEVKAYDNGQEIDLSKHKFGIDEQERTINGKPARATTFMLDGKPFGAVVVETADGTKADFTTAAACGWKAPPVQKSGGRKSGSKAPAIP